MLRLLCNKKGMSMVEVLIAFILTSIGIMALLALQPTGWKTMAKADYVGRASGILYKTLEDYENKILNPCNGVAMGTTAPINVTSSDEASAIPGDITYTVTTTTALDANSTSTQTAVDVTVNVSWPLNSKGISETMVVARQETFRYPTGCPNASPPN
jgi:Tfp pilus assembly protein PilE